MPKLKTFTDKYNKIIFDMDGVMTSEQCYWDTAALTVYELLNSRKYFGSRALDLSNVFANVKMIRSLIFSNDEIITVLKNKGVNSNWDLAYVVFCASIINRTKNPINTLEYCNKLSGNILDDYQKIAITTAIILNKPTAYCMREGELWQTVMNVFQQWYLGKNGHPCVMHSEMPLFSHKELEILLKTLTKTKIIGYGTGRPSDEIVNPMKKWGFLNYFDEDSRISYDNVINAEKELLKSGITATLTKPHPYMFLQAALGSSYDVKKLYSGNYDKSVISKTLIVGDAGADIIAAQSAGFDFCAVLTGVNGKDAKNYFENQKATYILDSVLELMED